MRVAEIFASLRKSGLRNTMVTSYFRPEVEIWPFRACRMKNMQYSPYLIAELPKFLLEQFGHCVLGYRQISRSTERISSCKKILTIKKLIIKFLLPPRHYYKESTLFVHGVCMLRECIYGECAHEQHVRKALSLTLTHTITAYSVSGNFVRLCILIRATRQKAM